MCLNGRLAVIPPMGLRMVCGEVTEVLIGVLASELEPVSRMVVIVVRYNHRNTKLAENSKLDSVQIMSLESLCMNSTDFTFNG